MSEKKENIDEVTSPQSSNSQMQAAEKSQGSFNYKDPNHIKPYTDEQQPEDKDSLQEPFEDVDYLPEKETSEVHYPNDPRTGMSFSPDLFQNVFFPADPLLTPTYDAEHDVWVYPALIKQQQTKEEEEGGWMVSSQEKEEENPDDNDDDYDDEDWSKHIQFIFDKRHNFKDQEQAGVAQQSKPGSSNEEEEEDQEVEEINEDVSLEDMDFFEKYMKIPEDPARQRLEKDAEMSDVADSVIKCWPENESEEYLPIVENRMHQCPSIESAFRMHGGIR
jgi:hypothetical protein